VLRHPEAAPLAATIIRAEAVKGLGQRAPTGSALDHT
jgi:hypothetical protein